MEELIAIVNNRVHDEDARQEVWVYLLSYENISSFSTIIDMILKELELREDVQQRLKHLQSMGQCDFNMFTPAESQLASLLILGFPIQKISDIMGINTKVVQRGIEVLKFKIESHYVTEAIVHRS